MRTLVMLALAGLMVVGISRPAAAYNPCTEISPLVANYLSANPGWTIVLPEDLGRDRAQMWQRQHRRLCPGMAEVDFDGSGRTFTALALIRHNLRNEEKLVLLRQEANGIAVRVLVPEEHSGAPLALIRLPPGPAAEWDGGAIIAIPHESLGVIWHEASARQYFWDNGAFRCVRALD